MDSLTSKKIIITGGDGFLGKYLVTKLKECGYRNIFVPLINDYNLVENEAVKRLYRESKPEIVIHLAAVVGGIGISKKKPGSFFYDNLIMGAQMMEQGRLFGLQKFVAIGTICSYPKFAPIPFKEENLWDGYPEESNASYGLAKKMLLVQSQAYRQQYGFNSICLLPVNLYGPGDNFDPKASHVISSIIKKVYDAKENRKKHIIVWGDGKASREFLYVDDAAEGILLATASYNKPEPVNLGSGMEITIKDLASLICELSGFNGGIKWDTSKPDGQPRRLLDTTRATQEFGFKAKTGFREGLQRTIEWYKEQRIRGLIK